ncbi:MAG: isoprenylcysteine carboxylmethyltransferase family protein [Alphaproteobacteria bacterium]|nr:isoprenylcysteine carboxylmethyltransferase family protein [Alphaproteobacteria bacterium]
MARSIYLLFGVLAYVLFLATFLYLVAFVGALPQLPRTVDAPALLGSTSAAVAVDLALIAIFGLQHSVMARKGFKAAWTRIVPRPIERSAYVVFASLALILLFLFWRPLPGVVWHVPAGPAAMLLWALFGLGWLIVLLSTFLLSHFELFGLKQIWNHMRRAPAEPPVLREPLFYRLVRHPLYAGFFIAFWATPRMTTGHLLLAGGMSLYMLIAIEFEERDLLRVFGKDYEAYRGRVGKLTPRLRPRG